MITAKDCIAIAKVKYKERTEYAYLPCDDIEIDKAVHRLGAFAMDQCEVDLSKINIPDARWCNRLKGILNDSGIYSVNLLAKALSNMDDYNKLSAVVDFVDVTDIDSVAKLSENLDAFIYLPEVNDYEELAEYWIDDNNYDLDPELEDYFLFDQYGEKIDNEIEGMFLSAGGYIYFDGIQSLDEIIGTNEDESMVRGGM